MESSSSSYGSESDDENSSSILSKISDVHSTIKEPCSEQEAALDLKNHDDSHPPPAYFSKGITTNNKPTQSTTEYQR